MEEKTNNLVYYSIETSYLSDSARKYLTRTLHCGGELILYKMVPGKAADGTDVEDHVKISSLWAEGTQSNIENCLKYLKDHYNVAPSSQEVLMDDDPEIRNLQIQILKKKVQERIL